jgi:hypothetical protein
MTSSSSTITLGSANLNISTVSGFRIGSEFQTRLSRKKPGKIPLQSVELRPVAKVQG